MGIIGIGISKDLVYMRILIFRVSKIFENVFEISHLCLPRLHLFDQKYNYNINIVKFLIGCSFLPLSFFSEHRVVLKLVLKFSLFPLVNEASCYIFFSQMGLFHTLF